MASRSAGLRSVGGRTAAADHAKKRGARSDRELPHAAAGVDVVTDVAAELAESVPPSDAKGGDFYPHTQALVRELVRDARWFDEAPRSVPYSS